MDCAFLSKGEHITLMIGVNLLSFSCIRCVQMVKLDVQHLECIIEF